MLKKINDTINRNGFLFMSAIVASILVQVMIVDALEHILSRIFH